MKGFIIVSFVESLMKPRQCQTFRKIPHEPKRSGLLVLFTREMMIARPGHFAPLMILSFVVFAMILLLSLGGCARQRSVTPQKIEPQKNPQSMRSAAPRSGPEQASTDARSRRFRSPQADTAIPAGPPSRFGLVDKTSQDALEGALRHASYAAPPSAVRRLAEFNVLKQAYIDPGTGSIILLGEYDPAYPTGAIPYENLLADALRNPYPSFSLSHAYDSPGNRQIAQKLDADLTRVARDTAFGIQWMERLLKPVLDSGERTVERDLLEKRLRDSFGITPQEFTTHWNWVRRKTDRFDSEQQYRTVRSVVGRLMSKVGVPERIGQGFVAVKWMQVNSTPETAMDAYSLLDNLDAYITIRDKAWKKEISIERATILLAAAAYEPILRGIKIPEPEIRRLINGLRAGRLKQAEVLGVINPRWDALATKALVDYVFHGFRFSNAYLSRMYALPPVTSGVELYGNAPDSPLVRIFFEADYALKYITSAAPTPDSIPEAMTFHQFLARTAAREGDGMKLPTTGVNRYWIRPGRVEMEDLGQTSGVRFISASVRIMAEPLDSRGGDRRGDEFFKNAMNRYANSLTARYDAYARIYPSLHTVREAEKVIALARWLKARQVRVSLGPPVPVSRPVPEKVEGFWGLTYLSNPSGKTDTIVFWMQGGVSFGRNEGEDWVSVQINPAAESDTLKQLAASTALAEKAAEAAERGHLSSARALAEQSAQAMTGNLQGLTLPADIPMPAGPASEKAAVTQTALAVIDEYRQMSEAAEAALRQAEPFRTTAPARYQAALDAANAVEDRVGQKMIQLRKYLAAYRAAAKPAPETIVEIRSLSASPRLISYPAQGGEPISARSRIPINNAERPTPTKEELARELCSLRAELRRITENHRRYSQGLASNLEMYGQWQRELERAYESAWSNLGNLIVNEGIYHYNRYIRNALKIGVSRDETARLMKKEEDLQRLSEALATKELREWSDAPTRDLSWFAQGALIVASVSPLNEELKRLLNVSDVLVKSAYDLAAEYYSWQAIKRMQAQDASTRAAVTAATDRMEKIVARIREIQQTLIANVSCE